MVKIVHDELTQLMGGETAEIDLEGKPAVILMSGLQGSGKTTFSGKLARMLKTKKNKKPDSCCPVQSTLELQFALLIRATVR